jgi:hypothetical protein
MICFNLNKLILISKLFYNILYYYFSFNKYIVLCSVRI